MCVGELPSVNGTLFSWPKRSHLIIEPPLFRVGFAIPEGAPLSGDHCTCIYHVYTVCLNIWNKQRVEVLRVAMIDYTPLKFCLNNAKNVKG